MSEQRLYLHLFKKENTQITSTSILHTFNILQAEFSKEKGKRSNHTAISTNFILYGGKALLAGYFSIQQFSKSYNSNCTRNPKNSSHPMQTQFSCKEKLHSNYKTPTNTSRRGSSHALQHSYAYQADSRAVPSILYDRKSFCAPTVFPGLPVILPVETAF